MSKQPRNTPTSVILTQAQKAFIKGVAEKEGRSYSGMVRFVVTQWIDFHSKKKDRTNGKEGQETEKVGQ